MLLIHSVDFSSFRSHYNLQNMNTLKKYLLVNAPGDGWCCLWSLQLLIALLYGKNVQLRPLLKDMYLKTNFEFLYEYAQKELIADLKSQTTFDINTIANVWSQIVDHCPPLKETKNLFESPEVYVCNEGRNESWENINMFLQVNLVAYGLVCHKGHFYLAIKIDRIPVLFSSSSILFFNSMVSEQLNPDLANDICSSTRDIVRMWETDNCKRILHAKYVAYLLSQDQSMESIGRILGLHTMYAFHIDPTLFQRGVPPEYMSIEELAKLANRSGS